MNIIKTSAFRDFAETKIFPTGMFQAKGVNMCRLEGSPADESRRLK